MAELPSHAQRKLVMEREHLGQLLDVLHKRGYRVIGPVLRDGAIMHDDLTSVAQLPVGWTDQQDGGTYRTKQRNDQALFGYTVSQDSWKRFFDPPVACLWRAKREGTGFDITREDKNEDRLAFLGVRACDLHAIAIQDKVFINGPYPDPHYTARRENTLIVAVNCTQAASTCFCVSMNTGPKATAGFDIALTEILENDRHYFLVEVGTDLGAEILREVPCEEASEEETATAERIVAETAKHMGRTMDTTDIKDLLYRNYEHRRWDDVAGRCLTCANCTMVCPTCFCSTVEDVTDVTGEHAERWSMWDSCFTMDFSYIHGGSVRTSTRARYRQWLTHKLATWIDQFGTSGCVGCGRCITWCPVGIDITEEVRAIREGERAGQAAISPQEVNHENS